MLKDHCQSARFSDINTQWVLFVYVSFRPSWQHTNILPTQLLYDSERDTLHTQLSKYCFSLLLFSSSLSCPLISPLPFSASLGELAFFLSISYPVSRVSYGAATVQPEQVGLSAFGPLLCQQSNPEGQSSGNNLHSVGALQGELAALVPLWPVSQMCITCGLCNKQTVIACHMYNNDNTILKYMLYFSR